MMLSIIHKIVAIPKIYDFLQCLAGASTSRKVLCEEFAALPSMGRVLDVGGGTGLSQTLFPTTWKYCCLDPDPQKLEGFHRKFPDDEAIQASACEMPLKDESFDLCIMIAVSHHLTDEEYRLALAEVWRVLRPGGKFLFVDAVWNPKNLRGRILWSLDRGSYPRTQAVLEGQLAKFFLIQSTRVWKVHHNYFLSWCLKSNQNNL